MHGRTLLLAFGISLLVLAAVAEEDEPFCHSQLKWEFCTHKNCSKEVMLSQWTKSKHQKRELRAHKKRCRAARKVWGRGGCPNCLYTMGNWGVSSTLEWRHNERHGVSNHQPHVYSGAYQRKHQSSASLAFMRGIHRWPVNSSHKGPVTRKFHLMTSSCKGMI